MDAVSRINTIYDQVPLKSFDWIIELNGIDVASAQRVDPPEVEIAEKVHHGSGFKPKTPGDISVSDCTIFLIKQSKFVSKDVWEWFYEVYDPELGGSSNDYQKYCKFGYLKLLDRDHFTIEKYRFRMWPKKIKLGTLDLESGENLIEKVVFSVVEFKKEI